MLHELLGSSDHLAMLPDKRWGLWRWVCLRSAGFPADQALRLADPRCAEAADRLLTATEQAATEQAAACAAVNGALDALRSSQAWEDDTRRAPLLSLLRRLKKGLPPQQHEAEFLGAATTASLHEVVAAVALARTHFDEAFAAATEQIAQTIRAISGTQRFQEALIWQNRRAFHSGIKALLRPGAAQSRGSKQRQHEELVASYIQRYCLKNDSIGFFGPVGWAKVVDDAAPLEAQPGAQLLASRLVSFEQWAIDALAETLARDKWLRPWLAPRRLPHMYLSGTTLHLPSKPPLGIGEAQAVVLQACDGERPAKVIAAELTRSHAFLIKNETDVYKLLSDLSDKGLILWTLEVPFATRPEQSLRRALERIKDRSLREPALAKLRQIEQARDAVADAAGDAERLDRTIGELETTFTQLTGTSSTRAAGAAYAARTLIYEDCRRDIEVAIGPELIETLGPPLSLLLLSARWFTFEAAAQYRAAFLVLYRELAQQSGTTSVDMATFWRQVQLRMLGDNVRQASLVMRAFQERWGQVLALPAGQRQVSYSSAALQPMVRAAFSAPRPGWQSARYHSPDVMIAAESIPAIQRGEYQLVMGELHVASNTLRGSFFIDQHPQPDELFAALEQDLPEPRVIPATPRNWLEITSRTRPDFVTAKDFRLAFSNDACGLPAQRTLPIASLIVTETDAGLVACSRDGQLQFDIIEFFADILSLEVVDGFKILSPQPHSPRITIDRLVVCRETWRFPPTTLAFAQEKAEAERFLAVRRWARAHDLPRWVFVKAPTERKPFFVDFDSPPLVNVLAKTIRRSLDDSEHQAPLIVSEMLPAFDQSWLIDADDQRYTSELRIVAVDQADEHTCS